MLKITVSETATEDRWILQGRLVGPWFGELKKVGKTRTEAESNHGVYSI